jgi:acyl transferase domain-containing protein
MDITQSCGNYLMWLIIYSVISMNNSILHDRSSLSISANRINYVFDLLGPSLLVDTACSSSLTAMHIAMQAIRNGECGQVVVVGANFQLYRKQA